MTKQITESEIRKIVENVIKGVSADAGKKWTSTEYMGRRLIGIYTDMNEAIDAAERGYRAVRAMTVEQREKIITEIRRLTVAEAQTMAEIGVAETGMGKVEHKRLKHLLVAEKTPGTEDIVSEAKIVKGAAPEGAFTETVSGIGVVVSVAEGEKCDRCWMHSREGEHTEDGFICARCLAVIKE